MLHKAFNRLSITSLCLIAMATAATTATAAVAQTADELVEKNIQAKGGREKLKAVQTIHMTGKMTAGQGMEAPVSMEMMPPTHKVRLDFTIGGMTGTQAYDGTAGWQVMPFMGKKDPEPMSADELKGMKENADFQGPLFDYKDKGGKVEYIGKADLEGTPVYKLKMTSKDGDVTTFYLDADSYLELKEESTKTMRGQATDFETTFGDYKKIDGVTLPFTIETKAKGSPNKQTITIDKVEINSEIAPARFDMPKVEKKQEVKAPAAPPPGHQD